MYCDILYCNKLLHSPYKHWWNAIYFFFTLLRFNQGGGRITGVQQGRRNRSWPVPQNSVKLCVGLACLSPPSCFSIVILYFSIFCLWIYDFSAALLPIAVITLLSQLFCMRWYTAWFLAAPSSFSWTLLSPQIAMRAWTSLSDQTVPRFILAVVSAIYLKRFSRLHAMRRRLNRLRTSSKPHLKVVYMNQLRNRFSMFTRKRV